MYSKQFILILVIFIVTVTARNKITIKVSPQKVLELRSASKVCGEKAGVDPGILPKVIDWTFEANEPTKVYAECLTSTIGFTDSNGKPNIAKLLEMEIVSGTKEQFIEEINECSNKITKESKIDYVFELGNCLHQILTVNVIKPST